MSKTDIIYIKLPASKIVSFGVGRVKCETKEEFLLANLMALVECWEKQLAGAVDLQLINQVVEEANHLYGPTVLTILDVKNQGSLFDQKRT